MKQYKDTGKPYYVSMVFRSFTRPHKNYETVLGACYKKANRDIRRQRNKSAADWWRQQTKSTGMPWLYHCGGAV